MKLKNWSFLLIILLVFYSSYGQKQEIDNQLYGTWNSIGYGQQLKISKKHATLYDTYESVCNLNTKLPVAYLEEFYNLTKLTKDSLQLEVGFTKYNFIRSQEAKPCTKNKNNPLSNFDALWQTFNENYAFFDLRTIDWKYIKRKYRKQLSKKSTDFELYKVLNEMISELNDGHASIEIPESLESQIDENNKDSDDLRKKVIYAINQKYITEHKTYNKGLINWGLVNDNVSYIQFNDFEDLANYNISNDLTTEQFADEYWEKADESVNYTKDVLVSFKEQMEIIYDDIKNTKSCIIDVRFNGGGFDQVGLEILSYFTNNKIMAFSKKARSGNGFTESQNIYIGPNGKNYKGSLYILTSPQTASASEIFVLASQSIENVITIGSNTEGILSDVLSKRLPNGWEYGLSNEVYLSVNGISYEKIGIPTNYDLDYVRDTKEFYNSLLLELKTKDRAIEKVIELSE
ncbi:S41 family peptidase [Winogradskyella luteola]|uniref:S41 family peptidase n=1 Tax=Winogradskyella luteola TaxID=2828330 RepID=A0A9X1FAN9_9FLAO|nr:S41 family peptidase [Winogradskyella luteola]MBV7270677.1 S41 family peptidase [Winogradskyella luteola]